MEGGLLLARLCGASCGLLVFSAMIFCGLFVGNPAETVILRAVGGLFFGLILGMLAGWIGSFVVQENVEVAIEEAVKSNPAEPSANKLNTAEQ